MAFFIESEVRSKTKINIGLDIWGHYKIFDAYVFINNLLKSARKKIVLIDNYIDESILVLFSKFETILFTIITKNITKQLQLDIEKYNKQYKNLTIKNSNKYHDRFLIIDDEVYHIGASLKDLGNKVFGFSKMDKSSINLNTEKGIVKNDNI